MDTTDRGKKKEEVKQPKFGFSGFLILFFVFLAFFYFISRQQTSLEATWTQVEQAILDGDVEAIQVVNKEQAEIFLKRDSLNEQAYADLPKTVGPHYYFNIGSVELFERRLEEIQQGLPEDQRVTVKYETEKPWLPSLLFWLFPLFLIFMFWRWISRGMGKAGGSSIFSFGQSSATLFERERTSITFKDVAGLDEAKQEVVEIVDFLKNPSSYTKLGAKIPKGVLLIGPPGTGKTLLAKAVAGEAQVPFFSLSGSEFVEMFVGVGASRVRDLFKKAKEKAPCIIFIDEIDAIGRSRGKTQSTGVNDERENTLNQMLTEMDGFATNSGVIVLAATNRGDLLDRALLRPGRFDRHISLELPDRRERKEIFQVHLRPLALSKEIDVDLLADSSPGFSGADIANLCNEAALIAARRKKSKIEQQDFLDALDRVIGGLEKKQKIISPKERSIVAFHEAGHALVTAYLKGLKDFVKVSIIPRGRSLGAAWYRPEELQLLTVSHLKKDMSIALAGRAAEEVMFQEVSSGALDDLERVTKQAYSMIAYYGLGVRIGNISYYDSTGSRENPFEKPYSEETAKLIDEEVREMINEAYRVALEILSDHRKELQTLGDMLLQKEVIYKEDLKALVKEEEAVYRFKGGKNL